MSLAPIETATGSPSRLGQSKLGGQVPFSLSQTRAGGMSPVCCALLTAASRQKIRSRHFIKDRTKLGTLDAKRLNAWLHTRFCRESVNSRHSCEPRLALQKWNSPVLGNARDEPVKARWMGQVDGLPDL